MDDAVQLDHSHKVLIYTDEAARVARLTMQYPDIETGGDLFGYWTHSGSPVVSFVVGPGRKCRRGVTSFYQDEGYLEDVGTELYDRHGLQHVGAWHSHHRLGLNKPSGGDLQTIRSGMRRKQWPRFLLLITTIAEAPMPHTLHNYFLFDAATDSPEPLRILQLPGGSPFRGGTDDVREEEAYDAREASWKPGPCTPGIPRTVEDVFTDAWFTRREGKALLVHALARFADAGIRCRMIPSEDGQSLKLILPAATLFLGPRYPQEAPVWVGAERESSHQAWSPETELADWYIRSTQRDVSDQPSTPTTGDDRDGSNDPAGTREETVEGALPQVRDSKP